MVDGGNTKKLLGGAVWKKPVESGRTQQFQQPARSLVWTVYQHLSLSHASLSLEGASFVCFYLIPRPIIVQSERYHPLVVLSRT